MNFLDAAYHVLTSAETPLHYSEIAKRALAEDILTTSGLTPDATMGSRLYVDTKRKNSRFVRAGKGTFDLAKKVQSNEISERVDTINQKTRKELKALLHKMPPDRFEGLIKELLLELGFEESTVEVTSYSNDGGIDVRGILNAGGLTEIVAAVQVKRWKKNVQARTVRTVRGSITTQEQGIIITTSGFSKGARLEANALGKVPISLVDGEQLLDLLFDKEIGINAEKHTVYALDEEWWSELIEPSRKSVVKPIEPQPSPSIDVAYPVVVRSTYNHQIIAELLDADGNMRYGGKHFTSPSGAGKEASGWKSANGWTYWQFQHPISAEWEPIDLLRKANR